MRLSRLEMVGFGAFRERVALDFEDADFFALIGPTGSGKSTVIDAVCFALYGSVPRYDNKNLIKHTISMGASEAKVCLAFELEGVEYVVTRVMRKNAQGGVATKEARLECGDDVLAGTERELSHQVQRLLGLRFDDFTQCVALPQGEFAKFLRAKGSERRDLLIQLLNLGVYERIGKRARQIAAEARNRNGLLNERIAELASATPDALRLVKKRKKALEELKKDVSRALKEVRLLEADIASRQAAHDEAAEAVEALRRVAVPAAARDLGKQQSDLKIKAESSREQVDERSEARRAAALALEELPRAAELDLALAAHDETANVNAALESLAQETAAARDDEADAAAAVKLKTEELEAAEAACDAARQANLAHELAKSLTAGAECPVCLQPVTTLPVHPNAPAVPKAEAAVGKAKKLLQGAREAHTKAAAAVQRLAGQDEMNRQRLAELADKTRSYPDADRAKALRAQVAEAEARRDEAQLAEDEAREALTSVEKQAKKLADAEQKLRAAFSQQRDSVAQLGPPAPEHESLLADWEALAGWAASTVPSFDVRRDEAVAALAELKEARAEKVSCLRERCRSLQVEPPKSDDADGFVEAASEALTRATAEVKSISDAIDKTKELRLEVATLDEQTAVAEQLGTLMKADNFPDWLLVEALDLLAADASTKLRELTGGRYSLSSTSDEFTVVDHDNADEPRPARTLSGGETFQASLALALALSEQIRHLAAEGAPRLDAIFLDEGFGTLDAETLEVVAATIENLGQSGRMVGVITHVSELGLRVPVRFEVRKGTRTSTVEKVVV